MRLFANAETKVVGASIYSNRKAILAAIRNALLVVAAIHILIVLRNTSFEELSLDNLLLRNRGHFLRWLSWSLVAVWIALLARYFATRRLEWYQASGLLLFGCITSISLYYVLEELFKVLVLGVPFFESFSETRKNLLWGWDLPILGVVLSTSLALEYHEHKRLKEVQASRLERELAVNTLVTLKAQIQPHFLFNTLHLISALIKSNPEAAASTVARLSDLIRASMKGPDTPEITMTAELDMLMNYIEIVQMRFRDRLHFDLDVHPSTAEALVPGFFLQPLVENAVRHGIAQDIEGGTIRVKALRRRRTLVVHVSDTGPGFSGSREELLSRGSGLSNLRRRLELLYPGNFSLEFLRNDGGGALVAVELPFRTTQTLTAGN